MTATLERPPARTTAKLDPPVPPIPQWRVIASISCLTLAGVALWCVAYVLVFSNIQHARTQHELYAKFRTELATATAPIGGVIPIGKPVAVISIADADLSSEVVVEGTSSGALRAGPGHVRNSPLPGQPGTSVIYGRAVSFGAPFGEVGSLTPGAIITVTTDQGTFHFSVTDIRHAGDPWTLPLPGESALTLVTSQGGWTPDKVVYVDATLHGTKPAQDPGGRLSAVTPQEQAMAGETGPSILMQLVLWLQLLVAVACGLAWLRTRWRLAQVWLIAVPAVLAVLWGTSNVAVRLLPNLL